MEKTSVEEEEKSKGLPEGVPSFSSLYPGAGEEDVERGRVRIGGYDFSVGGKVDYERLFQSFLPTGLQASNVALAMEIINEIYEIRYGKGKEKPGIVYGKDERRKVLEKEEITVFLAFTSNMISCGVREIIRYLVQHHFVDAVCTTTGGIEEDIMKCLADTYVGDFSLDGKTLRRTVKALSGKKLTILVRFIGSEPYW